jgi:NarL family two-component system response regulator LiaR
MTKIKVLIVDDHAVVRQGLRSFLELHETIEIIGEAGDGFEAISAVKKERPDVILMDLLMTKMDGITAIKKIREFEPDINIIVLTSYSEDKKVFPAIKAGVMGYLLKDISPQELIKAIEAVNKGERQLHPDIMNKLMNQFVDPQFKSPVNPGELTEREMEVLTLIAEGLSNIQLAENLSISEKTVKTHVSNILSKLNLTDRTQAAIYAFKYGLVE